MHEITIRLSVPTTESGTLGIAQWIGDTLTQDPIEGMVVHEFSVEESDG